MTASSDDMVAAMLSRLRERTGRDLAGWLRTVRASGLDLLDQRAVRVWLESRHGIAPELSRVIAERAARDAGWIPQTVTECVAQLYAGARAPLRPIHDRIAELALALGPDVTMQARGTYVPFVRRRQFAAVAPAGRGQVDLGLRFVEPPASSRLTAANAPGQCTHKLALASPAEVDDEVRTLIRAAYHQNG